MLAQTQTTDHPFSPAAQSPDCRPLGWCGWLVSAPATFRPFKIEGGSGRGTLGLADDERPRLIIKWAKLPNWARTTRIPSRREKLVRRQLLRGLPRKRAKELRDMIEPIDNPRFDPMLCLPDEEGGATRCAAYSPVSGRIIDLLYRHGKKREDKLIRRTTLATMIDQPTDEPGRWAVFDISFIAMPRMRYAESMLKIGDMRVRLAGRPKRGFLRREAGVQFIYPADLALRRMAMNKWLERILADRHREYRLLRVLQRSEKRYESLETPIGPALSCRTYLRPVLRLLRWRTPRQMRHWIVHDQQRNRLIVVQAATRQRDLDETMTTLTHGLHWADRDG